MSDTQSRHGGANVKFPPPLVFVLLIGVGALLQHFVRALSLPAAPWVGYVVGGALIVAGLAIGLPALRWFKRTGQDPKPWMPSPQLIADGIYRYTRNPMYVSMALFQLGIGAALDNFWIVGGALVALVIVHYVAVRPEERYLTEKFGDSYRAYQKSVRRYL